MTWTNALSFWPLVFWAILLVSMDTLNIFEDRKFWLYSFLNETQLFRRCLDLCLFLSQNYVLNYIAL